MMHRFKQSSPLLSIRYKSTSTKSITKKSTTAFPQVWYRFVDKNGDYVGSPSFVEVSPEASTTVTHVLKKVKEYQSSKIISSFGDSDMNVYSFTEGDIATLLKGPQLKRGKKVQELLAQGIGMDYDNVLIIQVPTLYIEWNNYDSTLNAVEKNLKTRVREWADKADTEKYNAEYAPMRLTNKCIGSAPLDRDNAMSKLYSQWEERNYRRLSESFIDETTVNGTMGAPGSGKSFFIDLIARKHFKKPATFKDQVSADFWRHIDNAVAVPITFSGAFMHDLVFKPSNATGNIRLDPAMNLDLEYQFSLRFLYSYFYGILNGTMPSWHDWVRYFSAGEILPSLENVIFFIRQHYWKTIRHCEGSFEDQYIILLVDESFRLQMTGNVKLANGKEIAHIDHILTCLGNQLIHPQVQFLVSSLSMNTLESATYSKRVISWIPLEPLSIDSVMKMFDETLFLPRDSPRRQDRLTVAKYLLYSCGGHPRCITYLYEYLKGRTNDPLFFQSDIEDFVQATNKPLIVNPSALLINYALSGKKVTLKTVIENESVDMLIAKGLLFNNLEDSTSEFEPLILPWQLCSVAYRNDSLMTKAVNWMMKYSLLQLKTGKPFERFFAGWLYLISKMSLRLATFVSLMSENGHFHAAKGVPFSALFYTEDYLKRHASVHHWGPQVNPGFSFADFQVTSRLEEFPPKSRVLKNESGKLIKLESNSILLCGQENNPSCDFAAFVRDIYGRWHMIFGNTKCQFADTKNSLFSLKDADDLSDQTRLKLKDYGYLQSDGSYDMFGHKVDKENIHFMLVTLNENIETESKDGVFLLGGKLAKSAFTPSLLQMSMFVAKKEDGLASSS